MKGWGGLLADTVSGCLQGMMDLVFPPVCAACGNDLLTPSVVQTFDKAEAVGEVALCPSCKAQLELDYPAECRGCGAGLTRIQIASSQTGPLANDEQADANKVTGLTQESCPHCRRESFRFHRCTSLGNYEKGLRDAVLKSKAGGHDALIVALAKLLAAKLGGTGCDIILPVPIHWRRRLGRPTVVSELLARQLGSKMGKPVVTRGLRFNRLTNKQGTLTHSERIRNMKKSLSVRRRKSIAGQRVLLVDDVMTSGATLSEATRICLQGGATKVEVAILARGIGLSTSR